MCWWVMPTFLTVLVYFVGVGAALPSSLPPMEFMHRSVMDQHGEYHMLWTPRQEDIIFEVQVATFGYVGLGFSPNGGMKGADIIIGWVDDSDEVHLQDRYGQGNWLPTLDDSQDLMALGGYQNLTHTVLRFSRPWNTCDHLHDFQLSNDTIRVIWAYAPRDPADEHSIGIHSRRGSRSLYLLEPRFSLPSFTDDVTSWTVHSPNVSVPEDISTLYWCKMFKVPALRRKTHVIGYRPVIEERNLQHVHHVLLYECHIENAERHYEKWLGLKGAQCYSPNMPVSWGYCKTPLITWAIGSEGEMFPEHAGFPLGAEHGGTDYFLLEIHYDNPSYKKGIVDSSGLQIFHTEKLRKYDAGVMTLGHAVSPLQIIPPAQQWKTVGHCSSECTKEGIPKGGVKAFQALLHAHLLGRGITLRHIRQGRELPVLFKDLNYDFNYQQVRVLKEEVTILPGDSFITECDYDSRSMNKPVFGGFSTEEEMCLVFVSYYPRIQLDTCLSVVPLDFFVDALGLQTYDHGEDWRKLRLSEIDEERENKLAVKMQKESLDQKASSFFLHEFFRNVIVKAPGSEENTTLYDVLHDSSVWRDREMLEGLQERTAHGPHEGHCKRRQQKVEGVPENFGYPDFLAFKEVERVCGGKEGSPIKVLDSEGYTVESAGPMMSPSPMTLEEAGDNGCGVRVALTSLVLLSSLLLFSTLYLPHS